MNVLSLFDGISCGRIALDRANIKVDKYYACEIDKYATKVSEANYPDIIRLGDVTKWREWDIDWSSIDLVTAGFPCQAWSVAGKQMGDRDPRGALFWTTLDIIANVLKHNKSAKFLMENVRMKKEFEDYITFHTEKALGYVEKTLINSALLSAQNRNRFYWTNFKVSQPEDKRILLKDILEYTAFEMPEGIKEMILNEEVTTDQNLRSSESSMKRALKNGKNPNQKANTLTASNSSNQAGNGCTNVFTLRPCEMLEKESTGGHIANAVDIKGHQSIKRVYSLDNKAPTLTTMGGGHREPKVLIIGNYYRKLTPLECERLQTLPDNYTAHVSNTQRYKAIGNGWTVDVIAHILKEMRDDIPR